MITPGDPVYPPGKPYRLEGNPKDFSTYEDTFEIKVPVRVDAKAKPGEYSLKGKLRYQACDDRVCLPPTTIPVEIRLQVAAKK